MDELSYALGQYYDLAFRGENQTGVVQDWTNRNVVFSAPSLTTPDYDLLMRDLRYWRQQVLRLKQRATRDPAIYDQNARGILRSRRSRLHRDWSFDLGAGATVGDGMFPAKFSFDITSASCANDFVVFNTSLAGIKGGQPNIIAFNNLYSGCGGTVPSVAWAYATGEGSVLTSPTLSLDGTKVAFVENGRRGAILRILKWRTGEGSFASGSWNAAAVDNTSLTDWSQCAANQSCMISLIFSGNPQSSNSPPFYNFTNNTLYAGDDAGLIHRFNNVFSGAPVEVRSNFPIMVDSGTKLTGPVYDSVSGNIFMGDSTGKLWYVRETASTVGACATGSPPCLGSTNVDLGAGSGQPMVDPPMVDPTTQKVFAFIGCSQSSGGSCASLSNGTAEVVQTDTSLGGVIRTALGSAGVGGNLHDGAFDNNYLSGNYASAHLYSCGNTLSSQGRVLFGITFDSTGTMNTNALIGPTLTSAGQNLCSPLTEIDNSGIDRIYLSVPNNGNAAIVAGGQACTGACLYAYDVTNGMLSSSSKAINGLPVNSGTSGIILDNLATTPAGTSQIYFSSLSSGAACGTSGGVGGCAVQASQAALR